MNPGMKEGEIMKLSLLAQAIHKKQKIIPGLLNARTYFEALA